MKLDELIKKSVNENTADNGKDKDELFSEILNSQCEKPKIIHLKGFMAAVIAAAMCVVMVIASQTGIGDYVREVFMRTAGISAQDAMDAEKAAPALNKILGSWNFERNYLGADIFDAEKVIRDYKNGSLTLEDIYLMSGKNLVSEKWLSENTLLLKDITECENFIIENTPRFNDIKSREDEVGAVSGEDIAFLAEYSNISDKLSILSKQLSEIIFRLTYSDRLSPESYDIPRKYRGKNYIMPYGSYNPDGKIYLPNYKEKIALGECGFDTGYYNTAKIYSFYDACKNEPNAYHELLVFHPDMVEKFIFEKGSFFIEESIYFENGTAMASRRPIKDFSVDENGSIVYKEN